MCGILAIFESTQPSNRLRQTLIKCSSRLRHRGPDWSGYICDSGVGIGHERLSIVDPESGAQPLKSRDDTLVLAVNGEIYNHKELAASLSTPYDATTGSDCEIIIPLYQEHGTDLFPMLSGMFSFVLHDKVKKRYIACRDHMGITPMYIGWGEDGSVWFASEMKAFADQVTNFKPFPPGHFYDSDKKALVRWYQPAYLDEKFLPSEPVDYAKLREMLTLAVRQRLMCDVPWGVLLSGGLDSSLVSAIALREFKKMQEEHVGTEKPWFPKMHSFSIGLDGSPDLAAAKVVADFLGTVHHTYTYTIQDGLDAVRQVIYHLETYDVTTIRAATPMFLLSRKIKSLGVKMVLSGEGADEMFGGYLYFHKAPNSKELFEETRDKLAQLYLFDCLRANKSTSAWGLEARVPFLDQKFLDHVMSIDPEEKMIKDGRIEKYILRKAFDTPDDPYLPAEVLWRQKEQFSDGVGYGWIDSLRDEAEEAVSDQMLAHAHNRFPVNPPTTKEGYRYRSIFEEAFPQPAAAQTVPGGPSIACSTPRAIQWSEAFQNREDCSGRSVIGVHQDAYKAGWTVTAGETPQ